MATHAHSALAQVLTIALLPAGPEVFLPINHLLVTYSRHMSHNGYHTIAGVILLNAI